MDNVVNKKNSSHSRVFAKFRDRDIPSNARWNAIKTHRYNKIKNHNETILNRQLNTDLDETVPIETFNTVGEAALEVKNLKQSNDDHDAGVELSERSVDSERSRLYGWTVLTILTLTGGIIITTMN